MRLSEFIKEALTDIAYGVHEARVDSQELVAIVPGNLNGESQIEKSYVEFDVAVTASDSISGKGGSSKGGEFGISVLSARFGISGSKSAETETATSNQVVSRISFKIPVFLNAHFRGDQGSAEERTYVKALVTGRRGEARDTLTSGSS